MLSSLAELEISGWGFSGLINSLHRKLYEAYCLYDNHEIFLMNRDHSFLVWEFSRLDIAPLYVFPEQEAIFL